MSLFVGNISKHVKSFELEDEFQRFGRCDIKRHGSYAFIEYDSEKSAEDAMAQLNGLNMKGLEIGIEWSKRSTRYDPREARRPPSRRDSDAKCYNCNRIGHFARDCRSRRRSRSRSGEGRRRRDSRSYSPRDRRGSRDYHRDDRRRSPDRRRRSPRRDSRDRRDDRDERRGGRDDRRGNSYDRRDGDWRDGGRRDSPVAKLSGSRERSRTPEQYRRKSPTNDDRRRSRSCDSGFKDKRPIDEPTDRPKTPQHQDERPQTDEREVDNGKANGDNPER